MFPEKYYESAFFKVTRNGFSICLETDSRQDIMTCHDEREMTAQILFYSENPGCLRQGLQGLSAWEVGMNEERYIAYFFYSMVSPMN